MEPGKWEKSSKNMSITQFVQQYEEKGWYAAIPLPDTLCRDVLLPGPLRALLQDSDNGNDKIKDKDKDNNQDNMYDNIHNVKKRDHLLRNSVQSRLWWSKGGTRSSLHYDPYDNLHCMVAGSKKFVLFPPRHISRTHISDASYFAATSEEGNNEFFFHTNREVSLVDVDSVDLSRHPGFKIANFTVAQISKGDCLFLPYFWLHQVRSLKSAAKSAVKSAAAVNVAVSFWWDSWTTKLNLKWTSGLSLPVLSKDGHYVVGDTERLYQEFEQGRRRHVGELVKRETSMFSLEIASGKAKGKRKKKRKKRKKKRKNEEEKRKVVEEVETTWENVQESPPPALTDVESQRWSKFIPVFSQSRLLSSSILKNYPISDQKSGAEALVWMYPELPRLATMLKKERKQWKHRKKKRKETNLSKGASQFSGRIEQLELLDLWMERVMALLLGDIRTALTVSHQLQRRSRKRTVRDSKKRGSVSELGKTGVELLLIAMDDLSDMLVRGNIAALLASWDHYPEAHRSISLFENRCGIEREKNVALSSSSLSRAHLSNDVVCQCVTRSGALQQKFLKISDTITMATINRLFRHAVMSDYGCMVTYLLEAIEKTRQREVIRTNKKLIETYLSSTELRSRMEELEKSNVVVTEKSIGVERRGGEKSGEIEGRQTKTRREASDSLVSNEKIYYDGGWQVEVEKKDEDSGGSPLSSLTQSSRYSWTSRCDILVLNNWSPAVVREHLLHGRPILLLDAIFSWNMTTRHLFTKKIMMEEANELWGGTIVYPETIPHQDPLLFECAGPACYQERKGETEGDERRSRCSSWRGEMPVDSNGGELLVDYLQCYNKISKGRNKARTKVHVRTILPTVLAELVQTEVASMLAGGSGGGSSGDNSGHSSGSDDGDNLETTMLSSDLSASDLILYLGEHGSGSSMVYESRNPTFDALLYGRKRWYLYRPRDAMFSRKPILEWLNEEEGKEEGTNRGGRMLCEQPANSVLVLPAGWGRGSIHMTDATGVMGKYGRSS